ncbi:MAG: hypothetical protein JWP75_980 [Frondihabitans sp.]|nr:hypothetical protein [Frondihabitans sp.]
MQYVLFICNDPSAPEYVPAEDNIEEWVADLVATGRSVVGDRLRPPAQAKSVVVRDGVVSVTDGPFAETREWIAGFDLIECQSLDEAVEVASRHPMARFGKVEVRATWPFGVE